MKRIILSIALIALLSACASVLRSPAQQRCGYGICLVYSILWRDSDKDGYADDDELAAGTDPFDANSHVGIAELKDLISTGRLPSFRRGFSELVVLPTRFPTGEMIVPLNWMPHRESALNRLGLTSPLLGQLGLSADNGLRVQIARPSWSSGGPPSSSDFGFRVGGLDVGLFSSGDGVSAKDRQGLVKMATMYDHGRHSEARSLDYRTVQGLSRLDIVWSNGDQIAVVQTRTNAVEIVQVDDGLNSVTKDTWSQTKTTLSDGTKVVTTTKTHNDGTTDVVTVEKESTKKNNDGSSKTRTEIVTTTSESGGPETNVSTKIVEKVVDADGTTQTTTTTESCPSGEACTTRVQTTNGYYTPEFDSGTTVVLTDREIRKVLEIASGSNTTPGPVAEGPVFNMGTIIQYGRLSPLIILVDPSFEGYVMNTTPRVDRAQPETVPDAGPQGR